MIEIRDNSIILNVDECVYCGSKNVVRVKDDIILCKDCGERFVLTYDFENPKDCDHCGFYDDCVNRFRYCPFDGRNVNEKLIESWRKERT